MFTEAQLRLELERLLRLCEDETRRLRIALSGGMDSMVLLHACHALREQNQLTSTDNTPLALSAIHINHGLSNNARAWSEFCEAQCRTLGVELISEALPTDYFNGLSDHASPEARAREGRYGIFASLLGSDEVLLTAHHRDDQAETILLRLLRGAGPAGLSGIPAIRSFGETILLRPLLDWTRDELQDYANLRQLDWVEDESNTDTAMDRNYLRHQVLPLLEARWPAWRENWQRSATLCAESRALNEVLASHDLDAIVDEAGRPNCKQLLVLDEARRRNCLRYWLQQSGCPEPGWQVLHRMAGELLLAGSDRQAEVNWQGWQLRRYRDHLHLRKWSGPWHGENVLLGALNLTDQQVLALPENGSLCLQRSDSGELAIPAGASLAVQYRRGGETCRLAGRPSRSLKQILQESDIPPWERDRLPLLLVDGVLAWVAGVGVCESFRPQAGVPAWHVRWCRESA